MPSNETRPMTTEPANCPATSHPTSALATAAVGFICLIGAWIFASFWIGNLWLVFVLVLGGPAALILNVVAVIVGKIFNGSPLTITRGWWGLATGVVLLLGYVHSRPHALFEQIVLKPKPPDVRVLEANGIHLFEGGYGFFFEGSPGAMDAIISRHGLVASTNEVQVPRHLESVLTNLDLKLNWAAATVPSSWRITSNHLDNPRHYLAERRRTNGTVAQVWSLWVDEPRRRAYFTWGHD
jgi:hypothetical protein